jgi:hypothetical protein
MIIYIILLILGIYYSFPGIVLWLCTFGICWEIAKAIGHGISKLMEDEL